MSIMSIKEVYEEIRFLTNKIGELGYPEILLKAAKDKNEAEMYDFLSIMKRGSDERIWGRIAAFSEEYAEVMGRPTIFYTEEDRIPEDAHIAEDDDYFDISDLFLYDPKEIKPINLCFLMILAKGAIDSDDLFRDYERFTDYVSKDGHTKIAEYMKYAYVNSLYALTCIVNEDKD